MDTATATGVGAVLPPDEVIAGSDSIRALGVRCERVTAGSLLAWATWRGSNGTVRVTVSHISAGRLSWHLTATHVSGHLAFAEGWGPTFDDAHAALRDAVRQVVLAAGSVSL